MTPTQVHTAVRRQRFLLCTGLFLMFVGLVWSLALSV